MLENELKLNEVKEKVMEHSPLPINWERTTSKRWLEKEVKRSRLLDDMQQEANWQLIGPGNMEFGKERCKIGDQSLRLTAKTKIPTDVGPDDPENYGRPFAEVVCRRKFDAEDWSDYNRLSFWVYPTLPGFKVISMYAILHNEGSIKLPDNYLREGLNFFLLEPDCWNQVVWEIPSLARDKVTAVDIIYRMQGHEPGATDTVCFDVDKLELQEVEADAYEGWQVPGGKLAYSHTGYASGGSKTAIAGKLEAQAFELIDADSGQVVLEKAIETVESEIGQFQLLDFSEQAKPGRYFLKAGDVSSKPFEIGEDVWQGTIWKTLNQYFCQRCGHDVPGIHGICHRDFLSEHDGQKIVINGGWHDAGDLSQGICNTAESVYALFNLANACQEDDQNLRERLIEEACWGLDWVLKTRFGDGYRAVWNTMDFWSDGILGTFDDITHQAHRSTFDNFVTAATEAMAARVLQNLDPDRARSSLIAAKEDWQFAKEGLCDGKADERKKCPPIQAYAEGVLASTELYQATQEASYLEYAVEWGRYVLGCQQTSLTSWDIPLMGFFYEDHEKKTFLRYPHRSHTQAPLVALSELCRLLPDHDQWPLWHAALQRYATYLETITAVTAPYHMFPSSIYSVHESDDPAFLDQVKNGIRLSQDHYLRVFPVWFVFRGNSSMILSDAKALASAAKQIRKPRLLDLCQQQLQWHVGKNPFAQSLMYGEGHDYAPQYTAMSGNIVGTLPVGVQTSREKDLPYWPFNNCYNYKEVWVQPSARWMWLMQDLSAPARLQATLQQGQNLRLRQEATGQAYSFAGEGKRLERELPAGVYVVNRGAFEEKITLLPRETYDLDQKGSFVVRHQKTQPKADQVDISIEVQCDEPLQIHVRSEHLELESQDLQVQPADGWQTIRLSGKISRSQEPWLVTLLPEGRLQDSIVVCSDDFERMGGAW